jgi:hypothetical protein
LRLRHAWGHDTGFVGEHDQLSAVARLQFGEQAGARSAQGEPIVKGSFTDDERHRPSNSDRRCRSCEDVTSTAPPLRRSPV